MFETRAICMYVRDSADTMWQFEHFANKQISPVYRSPPAAVKHATSLLIFYPRVGG